jgi:hypothetical protein
MCTHFLKFDALPFVNSHSYFLSNLGPTQKVVGYTYVFKFSLFFVIFSKFRSYIWSIYLLIFVQGERERKRGISSFSNTICWRGCPFLLMFLTPLWEIRWYGCVNLFLDLLFCFIALHDCTILVLLRGFVV